MPTGRCRRNRCRPASTAPASTASGRLGDLAHHQHRLLQGRRLLLDAAGVGYDEVAGLEQLDEVPVVQRVGQHHPRGAREDPADRPADVGIGVDREDYHHVLVLGRDALEGPHHTLEGLAPALPPVGGHRYDALAAEVRRRQHPVLVGIALGRDVQQGVDHRVADDQYLLAGDPLPGQRRGRGPGRAQSASRRWRW